MRRTLGLLAVAAVVVSGCSAADSVPDCSVGRLDNGTAIPRSGAAPDTDAAMKGTLGPGISVLGAGYYFFELSGSLSATIYNQTDPGQPIQFWNFWSGYLDEGTYQVAIPVLAHVAFECYQQEP